MAAITTLGSATNFPCAVKAANVGTTWQQFTLPPGTRYATIKTVAASYISWTGMGAADGGAVHATNRWEQAAGGASGGGERHEISTGPGSRKGATSVFVAAQVGTTDVLIEVEGV